MINKAILVGRMGKDPQLRRFADGGSVCTFSMATTEWIPARGDKEAREIVDWHNIAVFGKFGEIVQEKVHRGSLIFIEGRIHNRTYLKKDGTNARASEVIAEKVKFLDAVAVSERDRRERSEQAAPPPATADEDIPF